MDLAEVVAFFLTSSADVITTEDETSSPEVLVENVMMHGFCETRAIDLAWRTAAKMSRAAPRIFTASRPACTERTLAVTMIPMMAIMTSSSISVKARRIQTAGVRRQSFFFFSTLSLRMSSSVSNCRSGPAEAT